MCGICSFIVCHTDVLSITEITVFACFSDSAENPIPRVSTSGDNSPAPSVQPFRAQVRHLLVKRKMTII